MAIVITCACGQQLRVREEHAGRTVRCPQCQALVTAGATRPGRPAPPAAPTPRRWDDEPRDRRPARRTAPASSGSGALLLLLLGGGLALFLLVAVVGVVVGIVIWGGRRASASAQSPPPVAIEEKPAEFPVDKRAEGPGPEKGPGGQVNPGPGLPLLTLTHPPELNNVQQHADCVVFSPDGKWIVTQANQGLFLWDAATGQKRGNWNGGFAPKCKLAFARDGSAVYAADIGGQIGRWDVPGGNFRWIFDRPAGLCVFLSATTDGRLLTGYEERGKLTLHDVLGRKQLATFPTGANDELTHGGVSSNGKVIMVASDSKIWLFDLPPGARNLRLVDLPRFDNNVMALNGLALSPVAPLAATCSGSSLQRDLALWDLGTGQRKLIFDRGGQQVDLGLAFSPDGRWLAAGMLPPQFNTVDIGIWSVQSGQKVATLAGTGNVLYDDVNFSPDGNRVGACAGPNVYVWDVTAVKLQK